MFVPFESYYSLCFLWCSIGDLGLPIGELVRLVRIYSASWEENNIALKKLYESFESKQKQLNIAIRRLQLFDEQVCFL